MTAPVSELRGCGPKTREMLKKLSIRTVDDLVFHLPTCASRTARASSRLPDCNPNEPALVVGTVASLKYEDRFGRPAYHLDVTDESGRLQIHLYYRRAPWVEETYKFGKRLAIYGTPRWVTTRHGPRTVMTMPDMDKLESATKKREAEPPKTAFVPLGGVPDDEGALAGGAAPAREARARRVPMGVVFAGIDARRNEAARYVRHAQVGSRAGQMRYAGRDGGMARGDARVRGARRAVCGVAPGAGEDGQAPRRRSSTHHMASTRSCQSTRSLSRLPFKVSPAHSTAKRVYEVQCGTSRWRRADADAPPGRCRVREDGHRRGRGSAGGDRAWTCKQRCSLRLTSSRSQLHATLAKWLEPWSSPVVAMLGSQRLSERREVHSRLGCRRGARRGRDPCHLPGGCRRCRGSGFLVIDEQHRFGVEQRLALMDKATIGRQHGASPDDDRDADTRARST